MTDGNANLQVIDARSVGDVRKAILAARDNGVPFAVEATGHGARDEFDCGVLLKTTDMNKVDIDVDRRIARVGPGALARDVAEAGAPYGLAPVAGTSPTVGVTGYTLGGGMGWMSRRFGYAADGMISAQVVTADGEVVRASADSNPELFWALQGGGGNFGVVTDLEVRVQQVPELYGGITFYPIERAADVIAFYRDTTWPDALTVNPVIMANPPVDGLDTPVLALRGLHAGPAEEGARAMQSLRDSAGASVHDTYRPMTYNETWAIGGTRPAQLEFFDDLPDDVISDIVDLVRRGAAAAIEVRAWGGAIDRARDDAGPAGPRHIPYSIMIDASDGTGDGIAARATGRAFQNWLNDSSRLADAYTPDEYQRLRELKAKYDPDNIFRRGHNIVPATPPLPPAH